MGKKHSMQLMEIEEFILKSEGEWSSMRSGHSIAFKQFEEVVSTIKITLLNKNSIKVNKFLQESSYKVEDILMPFEIEWEGESNWDQNNNSFSGKSLLIPIANSEIILRSSGYAENIKAISKYSFLSDGTIKLVTTYEHTVSEERIWFIHKNVRCRSSLIRGINKDLILQTSFASEVRKINE